MALALQHLAKLYKSATIPLFYVTLYKEFIEEELARDKIIEGSKTQFAQVFPIFMEHAFTNASAASDE